MNRAPLPSSFEDHPEFQEETGGQKFRRRLKEEPLIPLGCAATSYALYRAYRSMKAGDSVELNRMFRARIYAQAFTLVAVVAGGMYFKTERKQRREFEQAVEARKAQEKRDAWLRELEIRDKEDRDWRDRHAAMEAAAKDVANKASSSKRGPEQDATREVKEAEQKALVSTVVAEQEVEKKDAPSRPDAAQAALEPADKRGFGVLDAVRDLISRR